MNAQEFETWMNEHAASFSSVKNHFDKLNDEGRRAGAKAWFAVLGGIDLDVARKATQALFTGKDRPRFVDDHPSAVLEASKKIRTERKEAGKYVDGQRTYRCVQCRDNGVITLGWMDPAKLPSRWRAIPGRVPATADAPCPYCVKGIDIYNATNRTNYFIDLDHFKQYVETYRLDKKVPDQEELDPAWTKRRDLNEADVG